MRNKEIINLDDGSVRVCLREGDRTICARVSSHHLVDDKWPQLNRALDKTHDPSSD
jgi:hypothetical protein